MLQWATLPSDDALALEWWWYREVAATTSVPAGARIIDWIDLPTHRVSPYVEGGWRAASLDVLARRYRSRDAVLVYGVRARELIVYGVARLFAAGAPTVGDALVTRCWLAAAEQRQTASTPMPRLSVLSLETVCAESLMDTLTLDPPSEARWIRSALDLLLDLVERRRARDTIIAEWGLTEDAQAQAAKMRYYVKLCLLQAPTTMEPQRDAVDLGVRALAEWTEGVVSLMATSSEHRAEDFVRRFHLPFTVASLPMSPPLASASTATIPMPIALSALHTAYARSTATTEAHALQERYDESACVLLASGGRAIGSTPLVVSPMLYEPALPTAFFARVQSPASDRASLLASLCEFLRELGACPLTLTAVYTPPLFAVRELIWTNGGEALRTFAIEWAARAELDIDSACYLQRGPIDVRPYGEAVWVPHPHVTMMRNLPTGEAVPPPPPITLSSGGDEPSKLFRHRVTGAVYTFSELAAWAGECVRTDMVACRAVTPFSAYTRELTVGTLAKTLARDMGMAMCARLHAVAVRLRPRPSVQQQSSAYAAADVIFSSRDHRRIEDYVRAEPARAEAFFRALFHNFTVKPSGAHNLRGDGDVSFAVSGPRCLCWKDFVTDRGGHSLGSLVLHRMPGFSASDAHEWVVSWFRDYSAGETLRGGDVTTSARPRTPRRLTTVLTEKDLTAERDKVNRMVRTHSACTADTTAYRYLRERRGLTDAPAALIEENRALRAGRSVIWRPEDTCRPPSRVDVLSCISVNAYAVQFVFIDPLNATNMPTKPRKLTHGAVVVSPGRKDAVCLWRRADTPVTMVILAEGPETGLSVAMAVYADTGVAVYTTLSVYNMPEFHYDAGAAVMVICRENDKKSVVNESVERTMRTANVTLASRFSRVVHVFPPEEYGDFNDIHQRHPGATGTAMIRACFEAALPELRRGAATPMEISVGQ